MDKEDKIYLQGVIMGILIMTQIQELLEWLVMECQQKQTLLDYGVKNDENI